MNVNNDTLVHSSLWGITRALIIHTLVSPLDVVKTRQQCESGPAIQIAQSMLQKEGPSAFYKGLKPHLIRTTIKNAWAWPMMTEIPKFLKYRNYSLVSQQAFTGIAIATIDAIMTNPLEKARIRAQATGEKYSLKNIYGNGWVGFTTYWIKLNVNWSIFLITQKYLRERSQKKSDIPLTLSQLAFIGAQTSLICSLVSAPFDVANTLKQAKNLSPAHLFSRSAFPTLFRGLPLTSVSLLIHSMSTVIFLDKFAQKYSSTNLD